MSQLDPQRERIQDDLRGLVAGEVRCDDVFNRLFASDAGIHEIQPLGVVRPSSAADVAACVRYAADKGHPIHARGAGTGVAGESLGPGLVLDFSAHLRRIIRIDSDRVRVQAGVVHQRLNEQLRLQGRMFAPDPATSEITTIGGMAAIDASGSRWLQYGATRNHVQSLQVVLADGQIIEAGREPLADGLSTSSIPYKRDLINRLVKLLKEQEEIIRLYRPKNPAAHGGYHLSDVLGEDYLDLASLLIGSEGTLALTTEASLSTVPLPGYRGVAILFFDSLEKAAKTVLDILPAKLTACELMDRRHLSFAREAEPRFEQLVPAEAEAVLLVEQEDDDPSELRSRLRHLTAEVWQEKRLAFGARQAFEPEEIHLYWRLVHRIQPVLYHVKGPNRPVPIVEDMAVPPEALADFLPRAQNALKRNQITASLFCHAGSGQIHIQPFLDLTNPDDVQRMRQLAEDLYHEVFDLQGSVSGEHGCGLSRTQFIRQQAGPLFHVYREIKNIFDPRNILNPGKIVGDDPELMVRHLSPPLPPPHPTPKTAEHPEASPASGMRNLTELQLNWRPTRVRDAVADCNRCGECRTQAPNMRMCPLFRIGPNEESSPRAKVNLVRALLTGTLDLTLLTNDSLKTIADLCIHCHACRLECPTGVDIPRLMRECKGAFVAANGLPPADWAMTHLDLLANLGGVVAPFTNWALGNRQMRWMLEKTLGISQGRKLPHVTSRNFLRRAARQKLNRPSKRSGQKVLYFVDVYANYFDPQLAEAFTAVLQHNNISVYVPNDQKQAGMPSIACGDLEHARRLATHNVALLAEAIRQGYHVVATEPAAALCLKHEYPQLLDDDDARLVAANSSEACSFLWEMHTRGQLQLDLRPLHIRLGYHMPCHLRALNVGAPGVQLIELIPGIRVRTIEAGCCGMAGTFGVQHANYRNSIRAGRRLISRLRDRDLQAGVTECSTCKMQMEQGVSKPTIHPMKLLALSYGLMPQIARTFNSRNEELSTT